VAEVAELVGDACGARNQNDVAIRVEVMVATVRPLESCKHLHTAAHARARLVE
jgi:hypothetical protein